MAQAEPKLVRVQLRVPGKQRMSFRLPEELVERIYRLAGIRNLSVWIRDILAGVAAQQLKLKVSDDEDLPDRVDAAAKADGREPSVWAERALTKAVKESGR